jgi:glycosyltransferase involved in cell wall biosynthesis
VNNGRAVLAGFYPPPFAGEPIHVKQLAELLRARGLHVEVVNLNRHAEPSPDYRSARTRWQLQRMLFALPDRDTILHLHTNGHNWKSWVLIAIAASTARVRGVRCILTLHSGLLPRYVGRFGWLRRLLAGRLLRFFARIVCVNHEIGRAMSRLGIDSSRATVIPAFLGVGESIDLAPADQALVGRFRPLVVTVGGGDQDPEIGLPIVAQACKRLLEDLPDLGVIFVGWHVGGKIRPVIQELGLSEHAACLGEVPHGRCLALLRAADVVVRSTFADGDAITVREALGLGVPVVASDTDFRPEGVRLFRRGDANDLREKLKHVLTAPASRGRRCPSATDSADQLWQLYTEVAGSGSSRIGLPAPAKPATGPR